jgi:uncharacterized protein YdaU (DUF1376 family)
MFPADFDADTGHLTLAEDGAYNRLLRLQWRCPGCKLPGDMEWIFRKAKAVTEADRSVIEAVIAEFFTRKGGKIWNARLLKEHAKSDVAHSKRVAAGSKGGAAKARKTKETEPSNAVALPKQPEPEPEPDKEEDGGGGSAREALPPTDRERFLAAMGVNPDGIAGPSRFIGTQGDMAEAAQWLALPGITVDVACAEIARITAAKRDGPPKSFRYFTEAIQRLSGQLTAAPIQPIAPTQTAGAARVSESRAFDAAIHALADRIADGTVNGYDPDRDPFARIRGRGEDPQAGAYLPGAVLRSRH